ncbi:DUF4214 domain-containing protein [Sodalinema gerasimenkoae]|uniref:DUF4214 domain-containing protein n=1 Tax=Sodalinema gerasimenkoae TaxID=2862348 RepID=UPI001357B313|nr:DUF4214 domain-containing protein [Sodalinema gerasimenkoae]
MDSSRKDGRYRASMVLAIATLMILAAIAPRANGQESCRRTDDYTLCFDRDWLRYYTQPQSDLDWQTYLRSRVPPDASDYYPEINRIYRDLLQRTATERELEHWSHAILAGLSMTEFRRTLVQGEEVMARINGIYQTILGRDVDESGLETWRQKLMDGGTLENVYEEVSNSEEALQLRDTSP